MNQPSKKIIQIGAATGDTRTGSIDSTFSLMINPKEKINPSVTKLTGISDYHVRTGYSLSDGYSLFSNYIDSQRPHKTPLVWGGNDAEVLRSQIDKDFVWIFNNKTMDVKTIFIAFRMAVNAPLQSGLANAMTKFGLSFSGRKHNAEDDAVNTLLLYFKMLHTLAA